MVTIQEARKQIAQQRVEIAGRRRKAEEVRKVVTAPAVLRVGGRQQLLQRQRIQRQIGAQETGLSKAELILKSSEAQIGKAEKQLKIQERVFNEIKRRAQGISKPLPFETTEGKQLFDKIVRENRDIQQAIAQGTALRIASKSAGFKNIKAFLESRLPLTKRGKEAFERFEKAFGIEPKLLEKIKVEELPAETREGIIRGAEIGLPPGKVDVFKGKVGRFFRKVEERFPREEKGIVGLLGLDKPVIDEPTLKIETPTIITDVTQPSGVGTTLVFNQREKTFFEKFDLKPDNINAINLKDDFNNIQDQVNAGTLSLEQAEIKLDNSIKDFTNKQIIAGVPKNLAIGAAIGLVSIIPVVGQVTDALLLGDIILRRRQIAKQFKDFPKSSALSTASFIVGNLVGRRTGLFLKGKGSVGDLKINPETLDSASFIRGKSKDKLVGIAKEIFPELEVLVKKQKITDFTAYQVKLKDGKVFEVLEFSKILANGKLDKQLFGFEIGKFRPGEVFVGRGVGRFKSGKGETFIRAVKFELAPTRTGRIIQKVFSSGRLIDIAEKTQLVAIKKAGRVTAIELSSAAGILRSKPAKAKVVKEIIEFIQDIKQGKPISAFKLKKIINLDRKLKGKKPFTDAEFKATNVRALTDTQIISILQNVRLRVSRVDLGRLKTLAKRVSLEKKEVFGGFAATIGARVKRPKGIEKTPLERTFREESLISKRARQLAQSKPFSKLKQRIFQVQKKKQKQRIKTAPSIGAATLIGATPLSQFGGARLIVPVFEGGRFSRELSISPRVIQNKLNIVDTRIASLGKQSQNLISQQKLLLNLAKKTKLDTLQLSRLQIITKTRQELAQQQKLLSRLKQKLKLELKLELKLKPPTPPPRPPPKPPPPPGIKVRFPKEKKAERKFGKPLPKRKKGFNVFVKSKGKFLKVNKVPLARLKALDLGSWLVDTSTSRTMKLSKTNKKSQRPQLKVPNNYWKSTQRKFRGKITKGIQQPITKFGKRIEKSGHLIDSLGEKRGLSLARQRAKLQKKFIQSSKKKPTKLKSTKLIKLKKKK